MANERLQVASTFTATPIRAPLRAALTKANIADDIDFTMYGQLSAYMLEPDHPGVSGVIVLVRLEDWLRQDLKSDPPSSTPPAWVRDHLLARAGDFANEIASLSKHVAKVWLVVCPSQGWVASRYSISSVCRTYENLCIARARQLRVTVVQFPSSLKVSEYQDHGADRLGQIPYVQEGFDKLAQFLVSEIKRSRHERADATLSEPSESGQFEAYLSGLNVQVSLFSPSDKDRTHIDRILRTAADFSLTGEKPYIGDEDIERLVRTHSCFLISVADRLSNYGASGLVLFSATADELVIDSLALSCVVLGKQVEFAVLSALSRYADERGLVRLIFKFAPTRRNQPMQKFLESVAEARSDIGYVVDVSSVQSRINDVAVSPGTWSATLQTSDKQSGLQTV
jgi:hypothetical protein